MKRPTYVDRVRTSLRLSVLDGAAFSAMLGLTQNYISPLALALKATTAQIGLLTSIPQLTTALAQLAAPDLAERAGSRKRLILPTVFLHSLSFIPILLLPFLIHSVPVWWLIGFVTVSTMLGAFANPAWGSMMADLVPLRVRGRYFSGRGRISGLIALIFSFMAGGLLQLLTGHIFTGFAILFAGAAVFRLLSFYFLAGMYEPAPIARNENVPHLADLARHLGSTNIGRFALYVALLSFATNLASPFFAVYMLRDLQFNYVQYTIVTSAGPIANLVFQRFWGRRTDLAGNMIVIKLTSFVIPFVPLIWMLSPNVAYLVLCETISGIAWSGFMLATTNFLYESSGVGERTRQIALYNAIVGIAVCVGAVIGGFIAPYMPTVWHHQILTLFLISGLARGLMVVLFLRKMSEVRHESKITPLGFLLGRASAAVAGTKK